VSIYSNQNILRLFGNGSFQLLISFPAFLIFFLRFSSNEFYLLNATGYFCVWGGDTGVELRASRLLGRFSSTWAIPPTYIRIVLMGLAPCKENEKFLVDSLYGSHQSLALPLLSYRTPKIQIKKLSPL
jgi:hypothetical protein